MERTKLKNIVIVLLLLLNLCFLLLVGGQARHRTQVEEDTRDAALAFLAEQGIFLEKEAVPWELTLSPQVSERDPGGEAALAQAILGSCTAHQEGNVLEYVGESGAVRFYPYGRFAVTFDRYARSLEEDLSAHARAYLEKNLGESTLAKTEEIEGGQRVTLWQTLDGAPVFTCEIRMKYQDKDLREISGWHLLGAPSPYVGGIAVKDAVTLLVQFAAEVKEAGLPVTKIETITPGYLYSIGSLSSQTILLPVWRLETDAGPLLLSCSTGELEASPQR